MYKKLYKHNYKKDKDYLIFILIDHSLYKIQN